MERRDVGDLVGVNFKFSDMQNVIELLIYLVNSVVIK